VELRHYAAVLWRWLWLILLGGFLAGGSSYLVSSSTQPVYAASTTLLVNQAQTPGTVAYNDVLTSQQLAKTYGELIHKRPVLEAAISELKLTTTPDQLDKSLSVRVVTATMLLELTAEDTDRQRAADVANAVAGAFIAESQRVQLGQATTSRDTLQQQLKLLERDIISTSADLDRLRASTDSRTPEARQAEISRLQSNLSQFQLTYSQLLKSDQDMRLAEAKALSSVVVAEPAIAAANPVRPKVMQNVLLAVLVGLMLAAGVALLIEYLDDTMQSSEDIQRVLGVPVLGYVVRLKKKDVGQLASLTTQSPRSPVVEAFRVLRTNLQFSMLDRPGNAIMVTSSSPKEGKTTTVVNLAQVMAQTGKRVIVVDTDLRRPSLHRYFNLKNDVGLTNALLDPLALDQGALRAIGVSNLMVLTSGPLPPNPAELLGGSRMAALIDSLKLRADVVLFDTPPALLVTDPALLAGMMDGILMVVDSSATRADGLARAREALERGGGSGKILGALLNKLSSRSGGSSYYYNYQHYYGHDRDADTGNGSSHGSSNGKTGKTSVPGPSGDSRKTM